MTLTFVKTVVFLVTLGSVTAADLKSTSLMNDWEVDPTYKVKCHETPALWTWKLGNENGTVFVSTPNFEHRPMFEEGPYYVNVNPITRQPQIWKAFHMRIEYRPMDQVQVTPRAKVFPMGTVFPTTCSGLQDKNPPVTPSNEHFSNSGVYIYNRYEVQIVDPSHFIPPVATGGVINSQQVPGNDGKPMTISNRTQLLPGNAYKVDPPNGKFINQAKPWPNAKQEWNVIEIDFCPPGAKGNPPAKLRSKLNDVVIFEGSIMLNGKPATGTGDSRSKAKDYLTEGPIYLQSHWGSHVDFRNPVIESIDKCTVN